MSYRDTRLEVYQQNVAASEASLFRELRDIQKGANDLLQFVENASTRNALAALRLSRSLKAFDRILIKSLFELLNQK